jgi:hypoxanthine phosphoribosyltransferase
VNPIESVVFSEAEIGAAVGRMAAAIARDYAGRDLLLLGVLKGAIFVTADLARAVDRIPGGPATIALDFLAVSSYGNSHRSSGEVRLVQDTSHSIEGRHVLIVEDIVDNGLTLSYLLTLLGSRAPATLKTAALLDKPHRRHVAVPLDYVGLSCPDAFVVGYGLDYQERYRTLPYLAKLRPEIFAPVESTASPEPAATERRDVFRGETF